VRFVDVSTFVRCRTSQRGDDRLLRLSVDDVIGASCTRSSLLVCRLLGRADVRAVMLHGPLASEKRRGINPDVGTFHGVAMHKCSELHKSDVRPMLLPAINDKIALRDRAASERVSQAS